MAHFAKIKNGKVVDLIVISNNDCGGGNFPESESIGQAFISELSKGDSRFKGYWIQTSYNTREGLHFSNDNIMIIYDENKNIIEHNGNVEKAFRLNFGQIGYNFDPNAGEHGEFYPPENNE
jgi:hypothetical protein